MPAFRRLSLLAGLLSLSLSLAACQTIQLSGTDGQAVAQNSSPGAICRIWPMLHPSRQDTADTIRQTTASNAARRGYGCPTEE